MNELHLFAGAGGGILGGLLLGHRPVCAVEIEPYCREVLLQRQRDGILPWFPIWDDVRTFDGNPWRGIADVVCGGFPCQDISAAGNGDGLEGERSGLWGEMRRVISEVRPRYVFVENSPMLTIRGLGRVLGELAEMGFNARWGCIPAAYVGAPHGRDRIWILADTMQVRRNTVEQILPAEYPDLGKLFKPDGIPSGADVRTFWGRTETERQILGEAPICAMDDGMAGWVDELAALGNGQVPIVAASAWRILS